MSLYILVTAIGIERSENWPDWPKYGECNDVTALQRDIAEEADAEG